MSFSKRGSTAHSQKTRRRQRFDTDAQRGEVEGLLELHRREGYGFLRSRQRNWQRTTDDPFVERRLIERYHLQQGAWLRAATQQANDGRTRATDVLQVGGMPADDWRPRTDFAALTPIMPCRRLQLETAEGPLTTRIIDLLAPLGRGQRGLIVAPPRTGKTTILTQIAQGIATNHPDVAIVVLLVDERPEEVTDLRSQLCAEFFVSCLDQPVESHVRIATLANDYCQRLAQQGRDVVLLIDSITRLARAANKTMTAKGPIATGGLHVRALEFPKSLFASARALAEGGSLTTIATTLVETESSMDEAIFREFKGTGNLEIVLDSQLADRRIWPAINIERSGARREELLLPPNLLHASHLLRRTLASMHPVEAMERFIKQLGRFKTNEEFIQLISGQAQND